MNEGEGYYHLITAQEAGQRLDHFLKEKLLDRLSRRQIVHLIKGRKVLCNGRPAHKGSILCKDDRLHLQLSPAQQKGEILPDPEIPLKILFEDSSLIVLNKAPGMAAHPLDMDEQGTVANGLVLQYPEMQGIGFSPREPGLVHRLDRDTSGVLLAARKAAVFERLRAQFEQGQVQKVYLALVQGRPEPKGEVDRPIGNKTRHSRCVTVVPEEGSSRRLRKLSPALTRYRVVRYFRDYSMVRLWMTTGVRHQLRAHMAFLGHPVAGDLLYRGDYKGPAKGEQPSRQLLHAAEIAFFHPADGRKLRFRCPLPHDFQDFLNGLL